MAEPADRDWEGLALGTALLLQALGCLVVLSAWIAFGGDTDSGIAGSEVTLLFNFTACLFSVVTGLLVLERAIARTEPFTLVHQGFLWAQLGVQIALIGLVLALGGSDGLFESPRSIAPAPGDAIWGLGIGACFAAVLLGIVRALLRNSRPSRLLRAVSLAAAGTLAALCFGGTVALAALSQTSLGCNVFRFDRSAWNPASNQFGDHERRLPIARSLVRCEELVGMPREDVDETLGKSGRRRPHVSYYLGSDGFLSTATLVVDYGPEGRVTRARVVSTTFD